VNYMVLAAKGETGNDGADGADGTGTVDSVNGVGPDGAGNVPITPDDLNDAATTNKFVTASQIATVAEIRGKTANKYIKLDKLSESAEFAILTDAATIDLDMGALLTGGIVTLGGNRTLANPTNGKEGFQVLLYFIQDATGSRTVTLPSNIKLVGATGFDLDPTPNSISVAAGVMYTATELHLWPPQKVS